MDEMVQTAQVRDAFDNVADIFEQEFENEITRRLRENVYAEIRSLVPAGSSILDINCGTGIDATTLAREGYEVVGLDVSPKMIEQAQSMPDQDHDQKPKFITGSFERLTDHINRKFDLVLSNFGGLNCIKHLDNVAEQVATVTSPGGYFVAVVMPRVCLWEIVAGLSRLSVAGAFRRFDKDVQATGFRGKEFTVYYHSMGEFLSVAKRWFAKTRVRGLSIVSPPPHATRFKAAHPGLSRVLVLLDEVIAGFPLVRAAGDHYLVIFQRRDDRKG